MPSLQTYPSKRFMVAALKEAGTWGTAVAVGAGDGLNISTDGDPKFKEPYQQYDNIGSVMPKGGDLGQIEPVEFAPEFGSKIGLPYTPGSLGSAIAALFGVVVTPTLISPSTTVYKHVFKWADYMTNFFTYVTTRPGVIWEVPACVVQKLSLKVGSGYIQGSIGLVGNTLKDDSSVNTVTQTAAITPESMGPFVKFQQGVLRMNTASGGALASGDSLVVSDLTMDFERTVTKQQVLGGTYMVQPYEQNFKITLKVTLPYATSANMAYLDTFKALTAQKMDIVFTGALADATVPYSWTFGFPRLMFSDPPEAKLEDIIKSGLTFVAEEAATAPTGMTGYVRPYIELANLRSTAYLA